MATDTSGQQAVDFVWGNFPMQPNEDRAGAVTPANFSANSSGDNYWGATTMVASERLNAALSNHAVVEAKYAGYPAFTGNDDGAYISGVAYIVVPSVLGDTTAVALDELKDAGYEAANITTASAATNTATQPTGINVTATTAATVTIAGGTSTWPVGTKVTISAGTGIPTALVGTWTVTGGSGSTLVIAGSGWTVANTGAITPGTQLKGAVGTIKTQSTAGATASVATTATITITPWAA
jgi:hypothetical protein